MHFGWAELLIICVICVMIFGVGKFQNIGKLLGKNINDFKDEVKNNSKNIDKKENEVQDTKIVDELEVIEDKLK